MTTAKEQIVYVFVLLFLLLQNNITSAQVTKDFTVRLINSESTDSDIMEGRLEMYHNGSWGTVCKDGFTEANARVACDSLGFSNIGAIVANRHGSGTGRIWTDKIICTGTEPGIDRCEHYSWKTKTCTHNEDVAIRCGNTPEYALRLINTLANVPTPMEGRLEINYYGVWGTVCDNSFTEPTAKVACASLGFGYSGRSIGNSYGSGTGKLWLDEVSCGGNESSIHKCLYNSWHKHTCGHDKDVSIRCGNITEFSVRLINSVAKATNAMEGQLEIYHSGVWGTVCDHGFTHTNARVACASLGFGYTGKFIGNRYGTGQGHVWLDDVICSGTEEGIDKCAHRPWGSHKCNHGEIVSIKCGDAEDYAVRLINSEESSRNPMKGRLEIYYAGVWGAICDDEFTDVTAKVVCASLGYGYVGTYVGSSRYGEGTGPIWLDGVRCTGREQSIDKCTHHPWGVHNCNHNEHVSVICGTAQNFSVRLVNSLSQSSNPKEGRLEIYYSGTWGTVCDYGFTNASAAVACASLGFGHIGMLIGNRHGNGTGQIWLKDVVCGGTEESIDKCMHSSWAAQTCTHEQDVSISCGITTRLVNSLSAANNPEEGRLEIYYGGEWGTVCSDGFTDANAKVACASLGFGYNETFISNRHGNETGQIWLDDVNCSGTEQSIDMCSRGSLGVHDCGHNQDVSIRCGDTRDFALRLINPLDKNSKEGRLEIYYSGIWGTVCNDHFTDVNARVACASLGFGYVGAVIGNRHGSGIDAIWLDDVKCNGTECSLEQCNHRGWGVHDCGHGEDVSISCGAIARLVNSPENPKEGRLEIYYAGVWGTVCDDGFSNINAQVACASLGFSGVGTFIGSRYGSGTGQIWLDDVVCKGTETSLDQCSSRPWGISDCDHKEDVSISCDSTQNSKDISIYDEITRGCGNTSYSGLTGTISSPSLTKLYLNRLNCTYFITVPARHKAVVTFSAFNIEPTKDFFMVSCVDGEAFNPERFSGSTSPSPLTITSCNSVRIWFYAALLWQGKGFSLNYEIAPASADSNQSPSANVIVISVLAILLGLCVLFVTMVMIRNTRKPRQERGRVLPGIPLNTATCSGIYEIDPTGAKRGDDGYEDLKLSGIYEENFECGVNHYQTINESCQSP